MKSRIAAAVFFVGALASIALFAPFVSGALKSNEAANEAANEVAEVKSEKGWRPLFDGASLKGWRGFHRQSPPAVWTVENGMITRRPGKFERADRGDLITEDQFENFEFVFEWRLSKGGNSGVKYLVSEELPKTGYSAISFEYQVLDDENHPDAKMGIAGNRTAAALYDLIAPGSNKKLRQVGEFNESRIIKRGKRIEHWLNGARVLEFEQGSPALAERIAASKFKDTPGFGTYSRGHILIQDHDDQVWYRNLKIRELK